MTDEELIKALREPWFTNGCERYQLDAADRIEALVAENKSDGERAADLMIRHFRRSERLEALLREADQRVVWEGIGMGNDFAERVDAALKGGDHD